MSRKTRTSEQITGSFLDEPPRVLLRRFDNTTGSYPMILRTGDKDRGSKLNVRFDDTNTIAFNVGSKSGSAGYSKPAGVFVSYPQLLPINTEYQIFPSSSIGVTRTGSAGALPRRGTFATWRTSGNSITPFNESRNVITSSQRGSYYKSRDFLTGTVSGILPGFQQPLRNKIQIIIDTSIHEQCDVYMSTGSASDPLDINTGLAYYNPTLKRFEPHGHSMNGVLTGSNANIFRSTIEEQTGSFQVIGQTRQPMVRILSGAAPTPFPPSNDGRQSHRLDLPLDGGGWSAVENTNRSAGRPVGHTGWPFAAKFNATSSQYIKMSDYINHPIVVEKLYYEFSASFGTDSGEKWNLDEGVHYATFHVARQGNAEFNQVVKQNLQYYQGFTNPPTPVSFTGSFAQTRSRDIIGLFETVFAKAYSPNSYADGYAAQRDLNIMNSGAFSYPYADRERASPLVMTGTYKMLFPAGAPRVMKEIGLLTPTQCNTGSASSDRWAEEVHCRNNGVLTPLVNPTIQQSNVGGGPSGQGADGRNLGSPRSLAGTVAGPEYETFIDKNGTKQFVRVNLYDTNPDNDIAGVGSDFTPRQEILMKAPVVKTSPYLLFPEDNLVLSWACQNFSGSWGKKISVSLPKGDGKLILYGSLVRDGKPVLDQTLNQNLTSDNIHETIHEFISDQFSIENRDDYYNTSRDRFITGTMRPGVNSGNTSNRRGTKGSFTQGDVNPHQRGSFQRFIRLSNPKERYYDTVLPSRVEYCKRAKSNFLGVTLSPVDVGFNPMAGGIKKSPALTFSPDTFYTEKNGNRMPFPYDGNPKRIDGEKVSIMIKVPTLNNSFLIKNPVHRDRILFQVGRHKGAFFAYSSSPLDNSSYVTSTNAFGRHVVCSAPKNIDRIQDEGHYPVTGATGFRYGIKNIVPEYTTAVFRADRYGQFRDMLEQRADTRFFIDGLPGDSAITTIFTRVTSSITVENSSDTNSCNLSTMATSSLPYFDGILRNRPSILKGAGLVSVVFGSLK